MKGGGLLGRVLEPAALSVRFQPVLGLERGEARTHYVECLIRGPRGLTIEPPEILFDYARRKGREAEVDRACVVTILEAAASLPDAPRLGINVHASTAASDLTFPTFLERAAGEAGIAPSRLVIEVVEHARPWNVEALQSAIGRLRELGLRIAVDDVGLGHSNLAMILACRPDYLKVDRYFVHGALPDFHRQAVLTSIVQLARSLGAWVVAEGVETQADLEAVRTADVDFVQGFLFGEPRAALAWPAGGSSP